uniref:PGG domain-containing protein n=1 Tax=Cucumis sativus TaxID=3659 RepID=A0A0A0K7M1_CUCSA
MAAVAYVFTLFSSSLTAEVQPYTPIIDNGPLPGKGKPKGEKAATLSLRIDNKQWGYWDRPFNFTRNPTCVYVLMTVSTVVASIVNAFSIRVPMFF